MACSCQTAALPLIQLSYSSGVEHVLTVLKRLSYISMAQEVDGEGLPRIR